jgi:hypothetical protein
MEELPIIQKAYDLVLWYVPVLNRLPRDHKYGIGNRLVDGVYCFLEELIRARYAREKIAVLESVNARLDILRYQTRILHDLKLIETNRYEFVAKSLNEIGGDLRSWMKRQRGKT